MTMFDVDELKPDVVRHPRGADELGNQAIEIVVRKHAHACRKPPVESGMRDRRRAARPDRSSCGPGEPARVRQLQADVRDRRRHPGRTVRDVSSTRAARKSARAFLGAFDEQELIGICTAVVTYGDRFAAPDQLRAAESEVPPSADASGRWDARRRAVPAFHRQDAEAVSRCGRHQHGAAAERRVFGPASSSSKWSGISRLARCAAKRVGRFERRDARESLRAQMAATA